MNRSRRPGDRGRGSGRPSRRRLLSASSDDRLAELVVAGDDTAFELLYARHVVDALAFADGLLGSREEAEEAIRHSFAAARAYLADGGRRTAFEPWLYAILERHCLSVLQRRHRDPQAGADDAEVVDLEQWRRRRKLLGGGLPLAPSAGLHESVMTACGIGGAATTAAPPLLGGTLAKVAVVVLLAGGASVAGDAVSDRAGPADSGVAPAPELQAAEANGPWPMGAPPRRDPAVRAGDSTGWKAPGLGEDRSGQPSAARPERALERAGVPVHRRPSVHVSAGSGQDPLAGGVPTQGGPGVPALPSPDGIVPRLRDRLKERLLRLGEAPKVKLPKVKLPKVEPPDVDLPKAIKSPKLDPPPVKPPKVDLPATVVKPPKVVDDGDVPSGESSIHVRALSLLGVADARR